MDLFDANGLTPLMACPECGFCSVPVATSSVKTETKRVKKNPMDAIVIGTVTAEEELEIRPELGLEIQYELGFGNQPEEEIEDNEGFRRRKQ